MNEIRFSPEDNKPNTNGQSVNMNQAEQTHNANPIFGIWQTKKNLKYVLITLVIALAILVISPYINKITGLFDGADYKGRYGAIFLTNGQVYFGQMIKISDQEISMNNVYYLQANQDGTPVISNENLNQSFRLVKLGNELHGPTDELFVTRSQVVFYEFLREDSKVVESIKNSK